MKNAVAKEKFPWSEHIPRFQSYFIFQECMSSHSHLFISVSFRSLFHIVTPFSFTFDSQGKYIRFWYIYIHIFLYKYSYIWITYYIPVNSLLIPIRSLPIEPCWRSPYWSLRGAFLLVLLTTRWPSATELCTPAPNKLTQSTRTTSTLNNAMTCNSKEYITTPLRG